MVSYHVVFSYDKLLENFVRTDREYTENRQRIQNLRPLLSPRIIGVSGTDGRTDGQTDGWTDR